MINVLIVDDHFAVLDGARSVIDKEEDMKAHIITDPENVIDIINEKHYDIYLVDLYMPKLNGIELTKIILNINQDAIILIYTGFDIVPYFNSLIDAGVSGFISKASTREQLITGIRCALREEAIIPIQLLKQLERVHASASTNKGLKSLGNIALTSKEQHIIDGVSRGLTNKKIAEELYMSQRTVEYHLTKVFAKLDVGSRTEALVKVNEYGLLSYQLLNDK